MGWVSPTAHNDPNGRWTSETNAYDDNEGTYAPAAVPNYYLELSLSAISCDKVRIMPDASPGTPSMSVDVYYGAAWHNIFSGELTNLIWNELSIGSTETVTQARIKYTAAEPSYRVHEFDFNEVAAPPARRIFITHV